MLEVIYIQRTIRFGLSGGSSLLPDVCVGGVAGAPAALRFGCGEKLMRLNGARSGRRCGIHAVNFHLLQLVGSCWSISGSVCDPAGTCRPPQSDPVCLRTGSGRRLGAARLPLLLQRFFSLAACFDCISGGKLFLSHFVTFFIVCACVRVRGRAVEV